MKVALDTQTIIYLFGPSEPGPAPSEETRDLWRRAAILIDELEGEEAEIIVPSIVAAELLVKIDPAEHGAFLAKLKERFFIPAFDLRASEIAATLWHKHAKLPKEERQERKLLKADVLIIATAKAAGADAFYTHDAKARKVAQFVMNAFDLPQNSTDMFVDHASRQVGGPLPAKE
ncbi:MAG TPA: PIN domain-containing protein [Humisphaera sp.]